LGFASALAVSAAALAAEGSLEGAATALAWSGILGTIGAWMTGIAGQAMDIKTIPPPPTPVVPCTPSK